MVVLRVKDIQKEYSISKPTAIRLVKDFENEILRADSKIPNSCLLIDENIKWVNSIAFYHFMLNRQKLKDPIARGRVKKFNSEDYKGVIWYVVIRKSIWVG